MYCIVYLHLGSLGGRSVGKYIPKGILKVTVVQM